MSTEVLGDCAFSMIRRVSTTFEHVQAVAPLHNHSLVDSNVRYRDGKTNVDSDVLKFKDMLVF